MSIITLPIYLVLFYFDGIDEFVLVAWQLIIFYVPITIVDVCTAGQYFAVAWNNGFMVINHIIILLIGKL